MIPDDEGAADIHIFFYYMGLVAKKPRRGIENLPPRIGKPLGDEMFMKKWKEKPERTCH